MRPLQSLCILATILAGTVPSLAAAAQNPPPEAGAGGDSITIGAGGGYVPSYEGSDDYRLIPAAAVRGRVSGIGFETRGTQLNVDVIPGRSGPGTKLQLGPIAGLRLNRTGSIGDRQVRALGKLDKAIELGGFVGVTRTGVITSDYDSLSARVSYVHDVAGAHGSYVVQPAIEYATPLSRRAYVGLSVSADIVGKGYAHYYFDVSPEGALASGLPAFAMEKGGVREGDVTLLGMHSLTGDLRHGLAAVAVGRYGRLFGDFRRSPLVSVAGSPNQWSGGLGLAYSF